MAVLGAVARENVKRRFMAENTASCAATKPDLAAIIAAFDDYLDANGPAILLAIPVLQRSTLTNAQKLHLIALIARARFGG